METRKPDRSNQSMHHVRRALQLAAMPVFLVLAAVSYSQPSPMCTVPGPYGFLTSMWFMYAVMAAAHSGAWLVIAERLLSKKPAAALRPLDCCEPELTEAPIRQGKRGQAAQLA
jgi:hypothetical protein